MSDYDWDEYSEPKPITLAALRAIGENLSDYEEVSDYE